jgi:hypothetical protein
MGLKYLMFMVKMDSDELRDKLVASGFMEDTEIMYKSRAYDEQQLADFKKIGADKTLASEEKVKKIMEMMDKEPRDKQLAEYRRTENDPKIREFNIWWMKVPKTNVLFGSFTSIRFFSADFEALASVFFQKAGLKEWVFVQYHHGSNEGNVLVMNDKFEPTAFPRLDSENERFEIYAKRVENEIKYPLGKMHRYLQDTWTPIPWEHSVTKKLEEKNVETVDKKN